MANENKNLMLNTLYYAAVLLGVSLIGTYFFYNFAKIFPNSYFAICLLIIEKFLFSAIPTNLVASLECEYYNVTECGKKAGGVTADGESCNKSRRTITCEPDTSSQKHTCWAAWQRRNDSQDILQFKGCFINNKQCEKMNTCVDKTYGNKGSNASSGTVTLFCCCSEDNCNREFDWIPGSTTTTEKPKDVVQQQRPSSPLGIFLYIIPAICVAFGAFALYSYKRYFEKKSFPHSETGLTDEENILLDKSESNHGKRTLE